MTTDPAKTCDRCDEAYVQDPIVVTVANGPLHESHSTTHLCAHCADSMSRWMLRKRAPHRNASGPPRRPSHRDRLGRSPRERRSVWIWAFILAMMGVGMGFTVWALARMLDAP